jgi:hypothetical protein
MADLAESDMLALLAERHQAPAWAFLRHVANGTGRHQGRTADALAMSLWPSRGLELHGFEVKVYRSDWLRELKDPAKADEIASRCHRWWVVASSTDVVKLEELPARWGLMVADGKGLKVAREAPLVEPVPLDHVFLAAILRRAAEAFCEGQELALRRARLADEAPALPTEADVARWLGRLDRLSTTASTIANDIRRKQFELRHEHRWALDRAASDEGEGT